MNKFLKKWLRPLLFTVAGAVIGLVLYVYFSCASGGCVITTNPVRSMIYLGLVGFLVSMLFEKGDVCKCNS